VTVIQCYAPTNDASEMDKDIFLELLQEAVDTTPRQDVLIISGDMNA
jgi:exonuclease III